VKYYTIAMRKDSLNTHLTYTLSFYNFYIRCNISFVKSISRLTFVLSKVLYVWQTLSIQMLVKSVKNMKKDKSEEKLLNRRKGAANAVLMANCSMC